MFNKIFNVDCIQGMKDIPDESIDLIVADPPYFKVINEKWDYAWKSEEDYLAWSEEWFKESIRTLRKGGSFYLFGYFRTLAGLIPILEKYGLKLRQQIVINKGIKAISGRATKNYKMFPNVTESIIFLYKDPIPFSRELLKGRQKQLNLKSKDINEKLGVKSNGGGMWSIYTGKNICEQLPTQDLWDKLQSVLDFNYPYEKISITFNATMGITDVWDDIDFYEERKSRIHPTQKPLSLINRIIMASSNEGDIILDPFMGSGTTAISCLINKREFIGFEVDEQYFHDSEKRIENLSHQNQLDIFS